MVAIIAVASAGVSFALRDSAEAQLAREAVRLAALFEAARARSLASGVPVRWRVTESGFSFDGLPRGTLPETWLNTGVRAVAALPLLLGPEPILPPQSVLLAARSNNGSTTEQTLRVQTDGVRPFSVQAGSP